MNPNLSHVLLDICVIDLDFSRDRIQMKFEKIQIFEILDIKKLDVITMIKILDVITMKV